MDHYRIAAFLTASIRPLGVIVGVWLAVYTFFGSVLPTILLAPPGVLTVVWFALLAWKDQPDHEPAVAVVAP